MFRGQTGNYVALYNGALAGEFIDASDVKFDGVKPDFADQAAINAIEAKLVDFDDNNTVGQILSILPTPAAPNSPQPNGADDITQILPWQYLVQLGRVNGGSLTITGLPFAPGSIPASFLAGLDSAAGGPMTPEQLNNLDSAAGGESANCWGDVYNKMGSGAVTFNFGGSPNSLINAQSSCGI